MSAFRFSLLQPLLGAALLAGILGAFTERAEGQTAASTPSRYYRVGNVVTNFTLYTRRQWTNTDGRVFAPGSPMTLHDFAGSVLFVEFFDAT